MKRIASFALIFLLASPGMAGLNCDITATYRDSLSVPPIPVGTTALASQIINKLTGNQYNQVYMLAEQGSGSDSTSVGLKVNVVRQLIAAAEIAINGAPLTKLIPSTPPIVVSFTRQEPLVDFSAVANVLAISIGGASSYRLAEGTCTLSDSLVITSDIARVIAHPVSIGASGFAAESFGDANVTRAVVEASVNGFIGGASANGGGFAIESVSIIPEMGSVSSTATPLIVLAPGPNLVTYGITTTFKIIADAKCAGLFCSLTGASTAGLTIPDGLTREAGAPQGIQLGPFTDESGGPLPAAVSVVSESSGIIYADPGGAIADTDQDGIADGFDNCLGLSNYAQRDTDGDGFGNKCDADLNNDCQINFLDLAAIKEVFFSADENADLDGNGAVDFVDLGRMKQTFFSLPGPSAIAACE